MSGATASRSSTTSGHRVQALIGNAWTSSQPAVRLRRHEVRVKILHAVAAHRDAGASRSRGHAPPSGDASAAGGVRLDERRSRALEREVVRDHRLDRPPAASSRASAAGAFGAVGQPHARDDELEVRAVAVHRVHQHVRERDAVEAGVDGGDRGPASLRGAGAAPAPRDQDPSMMRRSRSTAWPSAASASR